MGEALGTDLAKIVELQEDGHTLLVRAGVGWKPGVVGKVTIKAEDDTSEGHGPQDGRADDLPRYREGDAVQVPAVPDRRTASEQSPTWSSSEARTGRRSASCRSTAASRASSPMRTPFSCAATPTWSRRRWTAYASLGRCARGRNGFA